MPVLLQVEQRSPLPLHLRQDTQTISAIAVSDATASSETTPVLMTFIIFVFFDLIFLFLCLLFLVTGCALIATAFI